MGIGACRCGAGCPSPCPGAPRAWRDLHERFGRLPFEDLLRDAIEYADRGYPVSPTAAYHWQAGVSESAALSGPEFEGFLPMFAPGGRAPAAGQHWRSADLAETLRRIAVTGSDDFYTGKTAEQIAAFAARTGGYLSEADLAGHTSTWVAPIAASYRGHEVWELPPNGQGLAALLALNILGGFDMPPQAIRRAVPPADRGHQARTRRRSPLHRRPGSRRRACRRAARPGLRTHAPRADRSPARLRPQPGEPDRGGTVYLCAADSDGVMVSLIQSNYLGFGAHVVVPGTGVSLQCRGAGFSLDEGHPGCLAPGKRPYHTIIPGFLTRDGMPVGPFGIMGGHMQPQGHLQLISNTVDYGMDAQAALDAPRWYWAQGRRVHVEPRVPAAVRAALAARGHDITTDDAVDLVGCGQAIWRLAGGGYVAGTEARTDGCALGY